MTSKSNVRVRYAETDAMGVAHHSSYVVWLEVARVDWLKAAGMDYRVLESEGVSLAVSKLELEYRASLYFDDDLSVTASLGEARSRRVRFDYLLYRNADLVAKASTLHVPVSEGLATRLPVKWLEFLKPLISEQTG